MLRPTGSISTTSQSYIFLAVLLVIVLAPAGAAQAETVQVTVQEDDPHFDPKYVTIHPGDTVQWIWNDNKSHAVVSGNGDTGHGNGIFDSGVHTRPFSYSFTFQNVGNYPYFCGVHYPLNAGGTWPAINVVVSSSSPKLSNISTRAVVQTGDNVLIGGFIISGTDNKKVLLRAIGPSLANPPFSLSGVLLDTTIELHDGTGAIIAANDNWKDTQQTDIAATGLAPTNDLESAILRTLSPGNYTAIVRGNNGGIGIGLVEAYDIDPSASAQLTNISTRGFVGINDNVMIGGFIVGTGGSANVVVRAIGPSLLTQFQIQGALADPTLSLFDTNGTMIASNDNWKDTQQAQIQTTGLAPTDDRESAIPATLPSGSYTIILRGQNGTTGLGLVEVFDLQ